MDYSLHYAALINRAKLRTLNEYSETHHIIPKCMNGTDDQYNLVKLTPEEHFVAHQLLVKIYPGQHGLVKAANMMAVSSSNTKRNNKLYGWLRRRLSNIMSVSQTGTGNSQYSSAWVHRDGEIQKIKSADLELYLSNGWNRGRTEHKCKLCNNVTYVYNSHFCENHRRRPGYRKTVKIKKIKTREEINQTLKNINHQQKEKNSQYGTVWITTGKENKKVKKEQIDDLIASGTWRKGRTL